MLRHTEINSFLVVEKSDYILICVLKHSIRVFELYKKKIKIQFFFLTKDRLNLDYFHYKF